MMVTCTPSGKAAHTCHVKNVEDEALTLLLALQLGNELLGLADDGELYRIT